MLVHFVAIKGVGMSALAKYLHLNQVRVQGSDVCQEFCSYNQDLQHVKIFNRHQASNVEGATHVVFSSAINPNNPEIIAAKNKILWHRSQMLNHIISKYISIGVCGTHGKSTISALLGHILHQFVGSSLICGATLLNYNNNIVLGKGGYMVFEADESDGSMVNLFSHINIIPNIDRDHLNNYRDTDHLEESFLIFMRQSKEINIINLDNPTLAKLINRGFKFLSYSLENKKADVCLKNYKIINDKIYFNVIVKSGDHELDREYGSTQFTSNLWGMHNLSNTLAVIAACLYIKLSPQLVLRGLLNFVGIEARLQIMHHFKQENLILIKDYAHNPQKIAASLEAVNLFYKRPIVVWEPHRFSRYVLLKLELFNALKLAQQIFVMPLYTAHEPQAQQVLVEQIVAELQAVHTLGLVCQAEEGGNNIIEYLKNMPANSQTCSQEGRAIIVMGAGNSGDFCNKLLVKLQQLYA